MIDYKDIFDKAEKTLRKQSWFLDTDFDHQYGRFKEFENKKRTDQELFEMLTMIIFYSGFRASTVESKEGIILGHLPDHETVSRYTDKDVQRILADSKMIRNERKIRCCIANGKTFKAIIDEHRSFQNYLDSFDPNASFENLVLLKEELEYRFDYLGGTTVYHFLTDNGFNVLKPDRVLLRIFKRLGLIDSEKQLLKTVVQGQKFAKATGLPIRYIDIIFVKYGQQGESKEFGLKNGICLERNPGCKVCGLSEYCKYNRNGADN
jgi:DNA-3-methyladenine glycosylase I